MAAEQSRSRAFKLIFGAVAGLALLGIGAPRDALAAPVSAKQNCNPQQLKNNNNNAREKCAALLASINARLRKLRSDAEEFSKMVDNHNNRVEEEWEYKEEVGKKEGRVDPESLLEQTLNQMLAERYLLEREKAKI